jgi:hypothetical protein
VCVWSVSVCVRAIRPVKIPLAHTHLQRRNCRPSLILPLVDDADGRSTTRAGEHIAAKLQ